MRKGVFGMLLVLCTAGCATSAQREWTRLNQVGDEGSKARDACYETAAASAPFQALKNNMALRGEQTIAMKANPAKATKAEAASLIEYHQNYLAPCRKIDLETASKLHPALVAILADGYAKSDANIVRLINQQIAWGEFVQENDAIRIDTGSKMVTAGSAIQQNLERGHNAELAQRQRASAAMSNWVYQQQILAQNQQAINAMNRPRMTNCQYVGAYLQCTTF
jgi:hypothetical protein